MVKLGEGEVIVRTFRKHWFLPAVHTLTVSLLFVVPLIIVLYFMDRTISTEYFEFSFNLEQPSIAVFALSFWGLILWTRFFSFWSDHHLDGWVLTNKRIIDIEQKGFFRRETASFRLERLQDVTIEIHGITATIFHFGNVHAQTAGTDKEFVLKTAQNPRKVREYILREHDRVIESVKYKDGDAVAGIN